MVDTQFLQKAVLGSLLTMALAGCTGDGPTGTRQVASDALAQDEGSPDSIPEEAGPATYGSLKYNLNKFPMNKTVCDPFGGGHTSDPKMGVKASLHYRGAGQPRWYKGQEYVDKGVTSNQSLFFNDLYVPTRYFSEGFSTQTSEKIKDDSGNLLIEYFALKFETQLVLGANDPEGDYELSVLADDGVVLKAQINGEWRTIINDDGDHPTRMGCSPSLISMKRDQPVPIVLTYYQGPRMNIAHVLMWRLSHPSIVGKDAECGKQGNKYFFDPDNGGAPLAPYNRLLSREWKPVEASNFMVSVGEEFNPCVDAEPPVISDLRVVALTPFETTLSWNTNVPATSQLIYSTVGGAQQITTTDNVLRTEHRIELTGLTPETLYQIQAVSASEDLGRTLSEILEVTTLRSEQ